MTIKQTLFALMVTALMISCGDPVNSEEDLNGSVDAVAAKMMQEIERASDEEDKIVKRHYDQLSTAFRTETTLSEYHTELIEKHYKVTSMVKESFSNFDRNADPSIQAANLKDSLMNALNIPQWYQTLMNNQQDELMRVSKEVR